MSSQAQEENPSILSKAFTILDAFNGDYRVLTLTELTRRTQLPKSTVHRLIARLSELDALEEHNNGYRLGLRFLRQTSAMPVDTMRRIALRYMAKLSAWSRSTVHLAVLRGSHVVFLEALIEPERELPSGLAGTKLPARYTAIGRSMMAFMPKEEVNEILKIEHEPLTPHGVTDEAALRREIAKVVRDGYAVQRNEVDMGLGNIAMPIMIKQRPVGAIAVQISEETEITQELINAVKVTTQRIALETRAMLAEGRGELFPAA